MIFHQLESQIKEKRNYIVVRTPSRPDYFWGNFIILRDRIDTQIKFQRWIDIYSDEFDTFDSFKTFAFDCVDGNIGDEEIFAAFDFSLYKNKGLVTDAVHPPPHLNANFEFKIVDVESEIEALIEVHTNDEWPLPKELEKPFLKQQFESLLKLQQKGIGKRFGAYVDGKLAADLGIYTMGEIGRFNNVATHQNYRRQGLCGALMYLSSDYALANMGVKKLVIEAAEDYHALRIYESVGFTPLERFRAIEWSTD